MNLFSKKAGLIATHAAAFGVAFAATALLMARSSAAVAPLLTVLEYFPRSKAASLSYEWGTHADATEMMSRYIAKAETRASNIDSTTQLDLDVAKLRLAMLNGTNQADLDQLCKQVRFKCTPERLAWLRALRKVNP